MKERKRERGRKEREKNGKGVVPHQKEGSKKKKQK